MITLKPSLKQSIGMRIEKQIAFVWNGRSYSYNGDIELVPESVVNGVMGKRVLAHKRWARGGPAFTGRVVGMMTVPGGQGYRSAVYLVDRDEDRKIFQAVNIKSIE